MAQIGAFNPQSVEPQRPLEPLPTGWYNVQIVESEVKPTKNNDGHYLEVVIEVIDGEYRGRKAWDRLNLDNQSAQAKEIAYRTLSSICHSTNTLHQITDSAELHGKPLMARIVKRPATADYDESNDVKGYKPITSGPTQQPTAPWAQPAPQQQQQMAPSPYPPEAINWARQNPQHPEAQKILATLQPPAPPAWTPPSPAQQTAPAWTPAPAPPGVQPPAVNTPPWQKGNGSPIAAQPPPTTGWTPPPPPSPAGTPPAGARPPWEK
jgi:hypothetical protein